jgi:hypothetical protein
MIANNRRITWVILALCLMGTAPGSDTLTGTALDHDTLMSMALDSDTLMGVEPGHATPMVWWGEQIVTPSNTSLLGTMTVDSNDGIYLAVRRDSQSASNATTLIKFNQEGEQVWDRPLEKNQAGEPHTIEVDGLASDDRENVYVFGRSGSKNDGQDAFVTKVDPAGTPLWTRRLGTPQNDACNGFATDADGNCYIVGSTHGAFARPNKGGVDFFIAAYTQEGTLLWQNQIGTDANDWAVDIRVVDNNDIFVCAQTSGSLAQENEGQADFVVARYNRSGQRLWLHQYGSQAKETVVCMEIGEQGQVYVGGTTHGNLASKESYQGQGDAFIVKIAATGELLWTRQFGSGDSEKIWQMALFQDGSGDILVGGSQYPSSKCQAFTRRYSSDGELIWTQEFGELSPEKGTYGRTVAIDSANNCYMAGHTEADLFDVVNNGVQNLFIVRFDDMVFEAHTDCHGDCGGDMPF